MSDQWQSSDDTIYTKDINLNLKCQLCNLLGQLTELEPEMNNTELNEHEYDHDTNHGGLSNLAGIIKNVMNYDYLTSRIDWRADWGEKNLHRRTKEISR